MSFTVILILKNKKIFIIAKGKTNQINGQTKTGVLVHFLILSVKSYLQDGLQNN